MLCRFYLLNLYKLRRSANCYAFYISAPPLVVMLMFSALTMGFPYICIPTFVFLLFNFAGHT